MKTALAVAVAAALAMGWWWAQRGDAPAAATVPGAGVATGPGLPASVSPLAWPAASAASAEAAAVAVAPASSAALAAMPPAQALRALTQCHAANTCRVTSQEGLDGHFEIVAALTQQLERLAAQGNPAEQAAWARELLGFPDGHVQAAALALAARLPPSVETQSAAVSALGKTYDAVLLDKAYPVLRQWQQLGLTAGYDDMFVGLVYTGGWQAAQSVAENVGPFLNAGNVTRFEQVARELQPGARQQALLRSLRDYRLQQQGG
ncbi:hypothetical protein ACG02S_10850 [Roseateles sp. DC23W]|uniref:Uncharacterized protein n=1 Tax=Pelomonas dachongensis TaxID=3299029 RepID=A0ABW7ENX2_9BURK